MKSGLNIIINVLLLCCSLWACEVEKPSSLVPVLDVSEATEITRSAALVSCNVYLTGTEKITTFDLHYGTTQNVEKLIECDASVSSVSVLLTDLIPNTTYYYCFEVGNSYSTHKSRMFNFTTLPNQTPIITDLQLLGRGPVSLLFQFELKDDGGEPVLSTGLYCQEKDGEMQRFTFDMQNNVCSGRIDMLKPYTEYTIQGFAENNIGETKGEEYVFHTEDVVEVIIPGTLAEILGDYKYDYSTLAVSGLLNGTDILTLREMLGRKIDGMPTDGKMKYLDLTDASIVSGGKSYNASRFTQNDVISYGMFSDCSFLQKLVLPYDAKKIEEGAFENCISLKEIQIPVTAVEVLPSLGCVGLEEIDVAAGNTNYSSYMGSLYDYNHATLLWYPAGREENELPFAENIERIGAYAFQNCKLTNLDLPQTIKEIGIAAFSSSSLEVLQLPDLVKTVPTALFQGSDRLTTVKLGRETGVLYNYCFDGCPLEHLYVPVRDFPPKCMDDTFVGMEELFSSCVLHVPSGCKKLYSQSNYWGKFHHIVDDIMD